MSKKIASPKSNGATVTPTADPKSIARCGIPAPAPKGRNNIKLILACLLYTSPSPRDLSTSRMPSSA